MAEVHENKVLPEQLLGFKKDDLVELTFLSGFRGRIGEFLWDGDNRLAIVKHPNIEDKVFSARLDQLRKIE